MRERPETQPEPDERAVLAESAVKIPKRVALWRSIIRESSLQAPLKAKLDDMVAFLLQTTQKAGGVMIPSEFMTERERLSTLNDTLWRFCADAVLNHDDDKEEIGAVYRNIASDITALIHELYQRS